MTGDEKAAPNGPALKEALLPCPFCGSSAQLERGGFGEIFAACSNCWCHMGGGAWSTTEADAIEHWNRRAKSPHTDEVGR